MASIIPDQQLPRRTESGMHTRAINTAAGVLLAAMQQGRQTPTGLAIALDSARLLNSPETAAEFEKLLRWHREDGEAIAKLVARIERHRARLVKAEADLLEMRGLLSPNGEPRRIPAEVEIHERVAPAVEWLLNRVTDLQARLAEYERPVDEDPIAYTLTDAAEQLLQEPAAEQPLTVYRASHDSIVMGLYTTATEARAHCVAEERRSWAKDAAPVFDWIEDEEDGVAELVTVDEEGETETVTGYVVTALEVAATFDKEADA